MNHRYLRFSQCADRQVEVADFSQMPGFEPVEVRCREVAEVVSEKVQMGDPQVTMGFNKLI